MDTIVPTKRHLRSWQRRKHARPSEILDAALAAFAEKGYAAAGMADIAARAGITKGTIYLYFPSKEEVFKSLVREHVSDTLAIAAEQAVVLQGGAFEFLSDFFDRVAHVVMASDIPVLAKIIIAESGNFPELARFWRTEVIDRSMSLLSEVITRGIQLGEIRPLEPALVARLCVAPALLCLVWRTTFEHTEGEPFDYQAYLTLQREVLVRGLVPEGRAA